MGGSHCTRVCFEPAHVNQDERHLRRDQRRCLDERFFAWLQWKRRLLIRWEYYAANFLGFVQLACITMLHKRF
jgi:transposase